MQISLKRILLVIVFHFVSISQASTQCNSVKMPFIKNIGQAPKHVAFYLQTPSADVYFNQKAEINYSFNINNTNKTFTIKETLLNAKPKIKPLIKQKTQINVLKGKKNTHKNIPNYAELSLGKPWKGIDMKISTRPGNIEKIFTLDPHADVSLIKLSLTGQKGLTTNTQGELQISTTYGNFAFTKPIAWQDTSNGKKSIDVSYVIENNSYGFKLGQYDKNQKVIIDPLIASTYVGGTSLELTGEKYINGNNEIIIAGASGSTNFPGTTGVFSEVNQGGVDFVAFKFNATLCELLAMTYLGGSATDKTNAVAFDATGNIYFAGDSFSTDFPLPDLPYQPFQDSVDANGSIFIAALSADFTQVLGATHIGGDIVELVRDIEIAPNGNVYVTGFTNSNDYPYTVGAFEATGKGAIISVFNPDLSQLLYSTRLGGGDNSAIVFDTDGSVFIATNKFSGGDYTTTAGVYNPSSSGGSGAPNNYVAHMSGDLSTLIAATFIGLGSIDDILITGNELLLSTSSNIIITDMLKMDKDLTSINATFSVEIAEGVTYNIEQDGSILALGITSNVNFLGLPDPVNPFTYGFHGGNDLILIRINPAFTDITSFLFVGGSNQEHAPGNIIKDNDGNIVISGLTKSDDFFTTPFAHSRTFGGESDILIQKISNNFNQGDLTTDLIYCNSFESPVGCSCN